jgi:hypothetical protein
MHRFLFISIIFIFLMPYRHSENSGSTPIKSEIKVHSTLVQPYKRTQWEKCITRSSFLLYSSFLCHTDTHNTQPRLQSNRRSRCTISCWSIRKEHSETNTSLSHHFYHIHLSYVIQTLTKLDLWNNQIGNQGAQYLGEALQKNTVREIHHSLFISIIFIFLMPYRHSLDSTSAPIRSEIKVHNIFVEHYKRTKWDKKHSLHFWRIYLFYFIQTLTDLYIYEGQNERSKCIVSWGLEEKQDKFRYTLWWYQINSREILLFVL